MLLVALMALQKEYHLASSLSELGEITLDQYIILSWINKTLNDPDSESTNTESGKSAPKPTSVEGKRAESLVSTLPEHLRPTPLSEGSSTMFVVDRPDLIDKVKAAYERGKQVRAARAKAEREAKAAQEAQEDQACP